MKITIQSGQLELPSDFSVTVKKTNPLLSDQGDASIPVTIPASTRNLSILGRLDRVDRANRYTNIVDAVITVGPVEKKGQLVIDKIQRHVGIDASFAIDSSDLYASAQEKTLKEIMSEAEVKQTFASISQAVDLMESIYLNGDPNDTYDYTVFPVAVSPWDNSGLRVYQMNNEPDGNGGLVHDPRTTHEGDTEISVPEGYGIAPFLKLHKMLDRLFSALGYTMSSNCFNTASLRDLVLVHNCSDCLCNPTVSLFYSDLVPSCTLADFLDWLLAKFHAQPVVDSNSKTVSIVLMEDMLASVPDLDITGKMDGDPALTMQPSRRIILSPANQASEETDSGDDSLEAMTRPAARTFDDLVAKYSMYVEADEPEFHTLESASPAYSGCLVLRKATGEFYALDLIAATGLQKTRRLGTNHFEYDRKNSVDTEQFSQSDIVPLMLSGTRTKKDVMPYIGDRTHFHTTNGDTLEESRQDIILAWKVHDALFGNTTTGTTQAFVPYENSAGGVTLQFPLTNYGMYPRFWLRYNELLTNQAPHLSGTLVTTPSRFLSMDMSRTKIFDGQPAIPISASGRLTLPTMSVAIETIVSKTFSDGISDPTISPSQSPSFGWRVENNGQSLAQQLFNADIETIEEEYKPSLTVDATAYYKSCVIDLDTDLIHTGPPSYAGEVRIVRVTADITVIFDVYFTDMQYGTDIPPQLDQERSYANVTVTYTLTAG